MITANQCLQRYGDPVKEKSMVLWDVPPELEIGVLPNRIYCNKEFVAPLKQAFTNVIDRGLLDQIKTWDGCFNIRKKVGALSQSLHSWGIAIDINAAWNGYGKKPTMSKELVACFTDAGMDWGGVWAKPDGMHFQLKAFP
jgi:hypothetical protein